MNVFTRQSPTEKLQNTNSVMQTSADEFRRHDTEKGGRWESVHRVRLRFCEVVGVGEQRRVVPGGTGAARGGRASGLGSVFRWVCAL